ncbi:MULTISPECIES: hypothetical protein [Salinibaculum]|uniref:hypothetical protein n=1 Tax=Salinibaculum TaxID=2732368 RepID=UPI0030D0554D
MRRRATVLAAALVLATATTGVAVGSVAADDGGFLDGIFGDDESTADNETDDGLLSIDSLETIWAGYKGTAEGGYQRLLNLGETADAQLTAQEVQTFVNEHNESFERYINARTTATTDFDVVAIEFIDESGSDTRYLVADVVDGNYTNGGMVATTDRTVDERCELEDQAVAKAIEELRSVLDTYVIPGEDIDTKRLAELNTQYLPDVSCSFLKLT